MVAVIAILEDSQATGQTPPTKIGFVDVDLTAQRARSVREPIQAAERDQVRRQEEHEIKMREAREMRRQIEAQGTAMTPEELRAQQLRLEEMIVHVDEMGREIEKEWQRIRLEVMEPSVDRIVDAIGAVSREHGFDLVLRSDVVLHGAESLDITPLVVEYLDRPAPEQPQPTSPVPPENP